MKQAILTKYLGPTNTRGARVKAWCYGMPRGVTTRVNHLYSIEKEHQHAMRCLAREMDWDEDSFEGGALPDGTGYCFVQVEKD